MGLVEDHVTLGLTVPASDDGHEKGVQVDDLD